MSDIVERLLNRAANAVIIKEKPNLHYDAAHEIERLRAENNQLKKMVKLYDEMVAVTFPSWDQQLNDDDKAGYMIGYTVTKETLRQK